MSRVARIRGASLSEAVAYTIRQMTLPPAKRSLTSLAAGVVTLFTLASCSSGSSTSGPTTAPATLAPGTIEVDAKEGLRLDKSEYDTKSGQVTILYVNKSSINHNLLVSDSTGVQIGQELKVQSSGKKDTGTFTLAPGTYNLYCNIPGHEGMKAKLVVAG